MRSGTKQYQRGKPPVEKTDERGTLGEPLSQEDIIVL
jgi:hypothetical protein